MLIDSHCHLEMPDFQRDLEQVLQRAKDAGVGYIFTIGTEEKDWRKAVEIAEAQASVYAILGIHPHNAKEIGDQTYATLRALCTHRKVKACGEMGLDFFRNFSPRDVQLRRFREQINLAKEMGLPIVVHDREAHRETLEVLKSEDAATCGGIVHCFSGDYEMARKCIDLGFYISLPGSLTYRNADRFREIVKRLPLGSLLIETDAPFLTPVPLRGRRNEPSYVRYTAEKLAEIKKVSFEKIAEMTTANASRIYRLSSET